MGSLNRQENSPAPRHRGAQLFGRWLVVLAVLAAPFLALADFLLFEKILFYFDFEVQWIPFHQFVHSALRSGQSALWNPYIMLGFPQHAESQVGIFYPINLLLHWLPQQSYAVALSLYIHLIIGMTATYLLARSFRLGMLASLHAAICFTFSGYLFAQFTNYNITLVAVYLPLKLLFITWYFSRARAIYLLYFALASAVELLVSHANMSFITNVTAVLYFAMLALMRNGWSRLLARDLALYVLCMILVTALAAVQLLPTYEFFTSSARYGGLGYEGVTSYSHAFALYLTAFFPAMYGWLSSGYSGGGAFVEDYFYVGTIGILVALTGIAFFLRRRDNLPLAALGIVGAVCFLFSLGLNNPFVDIYRLLIHIPGFNIFRCPARWAVVPTLALAIFSGYGLQVLIGHMQARKFTAVIPMLAVLALAVPLLAFAFVLNEGHVNGWALLGKIVQPLTAIFYGEGVDRWIYGIYAHINPLAYFLLLLLALSIAVLAAYRLPARYCAAAIVALGFLDMLCVARLVNPKTSPNLFPANASYIGYLKRNAGVFRAISPDDMPNSISLNASMAGFYGIQSVKGYAALHLDNYLMLGGELSNPEILDFVGVKYEIQRTQNETYTVLTRPGVFPRAFLLEYYRIEYDEPAAYYMFLSLSQPERKSIVTLTEASAASLKLHGSGLPPSTLEVWPEIRPANITEYANSRVVIEGETQAPAFLLLTDMYYPGWQAKVDGESVSVVRLNGLFRGVYLRKAGPFRLEFDYQPQSIRLGTLISFCTMLWLIAFAWCRIATRDMKRRTLN
jgi:hypothetical protein